MGKAVEKPYTILKDLVEVQIAVRDIYYNTNVVWYETVKSSVKFTFNNEVYFITPGVGGYVATHYRTGYRVSGDPKKGIEATYNHAMKILEANKHRTSLVNSYPSVPNFNTSLALAHLNLL